MKNFLLLCLIGFALYLYWHPRVEVAAPQEPVVVERPTPRPKLYFHSPLDAPAMPVHVSSGTGYYSADSSNRFDMRGATVSTGSASVARSNAPVYYTGGGAVNNNLNYSGVGQTTAAAAPLATPPNRAVSGQRPSYSQVNGR